MRSRTFPTLAFGIAVLLPSSGAQAQWGWGGYGYGPAWGAATSSTQAAGIGISEVIRAKGQYALDITQAQQQEAQAQAAMSDARLQHTQDYFEMRRVNQQYRDEQAARRPRPTAESLARNASDQLPPRMSLANLDPSTGKINWPQLLTTPDFSATREPLDQLFAERATAKQTGLGTQNHASIERATRAMLNALRPKIREMDTGDYLVCRNFIESLGFEARFPVTR